MKMPTVLTCDCGEDFDSNCMKPCSVCKSYYCENCFDRDGRICVNCKTIERQDLLYSLNGEVNYEKERAKDNPAKAWTPDYTEGYIDGLKRAIYLVSEL